MRDRAAGDVLYLIVEHLYGWFSLDDEISDEDEWVSISEIGSRLNKRYPDFDVRNYGFRKLTPFIKSLGILDIRSVPVNEGNSRLVYVKVRS